MFTPFDPQTLLLHVHALWCLSLTRWTSGLLLSAKPVLMRARLLWQWERPPIIRQHAFLHTFALRHLPSSSCFSTASTVRLSPWLSPQSLSVSSRPRSSLRLLTPSTNEFNFPIISCLLRITAPRSVVCAPVSCACFHHVPVYLKRLEIVPSLSSASGRIFSLVQ